MKRILKPLVVALLLLLAGCNGAMFDSASTTGTHSVSTTSPSTTGQPTTQATDRTTGDRTTMASTKSCLVRNESRDGAAWVVKPTIDGTKVMLMTQWHRSANVTKLEATLDGKRLFRAYPERNASGWGRYVGTVPLAGQLRIELYDNGTRVGQYEADIVCRQTSSVDGQ